MYIKLRPGEGVDSQVFDERDLVIDIGQDGQPVGYDIQHASRHPEVIAEALQLLRGQSAEAAE
jgi:uncharacterized protein YuzE